MLTFDEFHPTPAPLARVAEGFLSGSALTAVIIVMLATMLLFRFEGHEGPTRKDLAIAWTPLILLDLAIVEFLLGFVFWYASKNTKWRTGMTATQLAILLSLSIWAAIWMWTTMSVKGGLGREEIKEAAAPKSVTCS